MYNVMIDQRQTQTLTYTGHGKMEFDQSAIRPAGVLLKFTYSHQRELVYILYYKRSVLVKINYEIENTVETYKYSYHINTNLYVRLLTIVS